MAKKRGTRKPIPWLGIHDYNHRDAEITQRILAEDLVNYYCYILVRRDLPQAVQTVQAAHAAQEVGYDSPKPATPTHFVVLGVSGIRELEFYASYLRLNDIKLRLFHEPDFDMGHTALCTYPQKGKIGLLSHLTLLGQPL